MRKLIILLLIPIFGQSQYCSNVGPSSTIDSNLEWLILNGLSGGINYTGCPGQTGLEIYSSQTVTLQQGGSYTVNLQFGTCGGNYAGVGQVWIDFNQNFAFEAGESIGTWQGTPPTAASAFNFTVPAGASLGTTRMRVMQAENTSLPMNPCASFTWGSATDFFINIETSVDCSTYSGDDMTDPINVTTLPYTDASANTVCYTDQHSIYPSADVYYKVAVNGVGSIKASLCSSSFDTFITATDIYGNTIVANDDSPNCGNGNAEINFSTMAYDTVFIIVEGWGDQSGDYVLNINESDLSIDELNTALHIFPNPSNSGFYIEEFYNAEISIYNSLGNLVRKQPCNSNFVSTSELSEGVYVVQIQTENKILSSKLIVRHE